MRSFHGNGTVIVMFQMDAGTKEINEFFNRFRKVDGTLVSELTKTYAVEVPAEEELHYIDLFRQDLVVREVNGHPLAGKKWVKREFVEKKVEKPIFKEKSKPKKLK